MKKRLLLFLVLGLIGCKTVSIRVKSEDDNIRLVVPFSLVKAAIRWSGEGVINIDDLGGVDQEIDLRALAIAMREQGDKVMIDVRDGDSVIHGQKVGDVFRITIDEPEEDTRVLVNLPFSFIEQIAESENGVYRAADLFKALKSYSGVLIDIRSPDESVKIVLR